MREKLIDAVRDLRTRVAWSEQDFNERVASGQRRPWLARVSGRTERCPQCGRRPGECSCGQRR